MRLFDRSWSVEVAGVKIGKEFSVEFDIEKTAGRAPNKAKVLVYGLSETTRGQVENSRRSSVVVRAGYGEQPSSIFVGNIRKASTVRSGSELALTIEADDGGSGFIEARINQGLPPGSSVRDAITACVDAMGIGRGNLSQIADDDLEGGEFNYRQGGVLSGQASTVLNGIVRSLDFRWSIQDGSLQMLRRGRPLQGTAIHLGPKTGMISDPEPTTGERIKLMSLMIPDVYPGRQVFVDSKRTSGVYRITSAKWVGQSAGDAWSIEMECSPIEAVVS